jgi:hypothetical protein
MNSMSTIRLLAGRLLEQDLSAMKPMADALEEIDAERARNFLFNVHALVSAMEGYASGRTSLKGLKDQRDSFLEFVREEFAPEMTSRPGFWASVGELNKKIADKAIKESQLWTPYEMDNQVEKGDA